MNVQPKLQTCDPDPTPSARPAPAQMRRQPGGPRRYSTWESGTEAWPLELEVEPWHP